MDLLALNTAAADNGGIWLPIKHPNTGDALGIEFRVRSKNSNLVRAKSKRYMERLQSSRDWREKQKVDMDQSEANVLEIAAICTADWRYRDPLSAETRYRPEIQIGPDWFAHSHEKAREIYNDIGWSWLFVQVDNFAKEESNFLPQGVPLSTDTLNTSSLSAVPTIQKTPSLAA